MLAYCLIWYEENLGIKKNSSINALPLIPLQLTSDPPVFKMAAVRGSQEEDYFKRHAKYSFRKFYEANLRDNSVPNLETGTEDMRLG